MKTLHHVMALPEARDLVLLRADGFARMPVCEETTYGVLREGGTNLIIHAEIDGHNYIDSVPAYKFFSVPFTVQVPDDYFDRLLRQYDAREQKFQAAATQIPHVPGYYWALVRDGVLPDVPVLVELRDESNVGGGLVGYVFGDENWRDPDCFYNYEGPLAFDPVWRQRGMQYGRTPPNRPAGSDA